MNQTRVFLILAWLMVATLLWMEWGKEQAAAAAPTPAATAAAPVADGNGAVPRIVVGAIAFVEAAMFSGACFVAEYAPPSGPVCSPSSCSTDRCA